MELESNPSDNGPGALCATCGKSAVFEHPGGQLRHCFSCGENISPIAESGIRGVLEEVFRAAHAHLLANADFMKALTGSCKIHQQVMVDSMVGAVSPSYSITDLFAGPIESAQQQLEVVRAPRGRGRPSKDERMAIAMAEQQLDRLEQARRTLGEFLDATAGQVL